MSSATAHMRAMLDGLMGTARDGSDSQRNHLDFGDSRVCRAFLLDCCPHDIFASTKLELGECSKVHDPALRADYLNATNKDELMYELSALERLQAFVNDADRRTEHLKKKLAETQQELSAEETSKLNRVHDLTELYGKKLAQIEKADQDGDLEAKEKLTSEAEKIQIERNQADIEYKNVSKPASSHQHQNLRVCDICSAYLGINDNDARLADHYGGKLHLGFITVREKLEDLKKLVAEMRQKQESSRRRGSRGGQSNDRLSRDRSNSNHRHPDRERDRSRSDRDYDSRGRMRDRYFDQHDRYGSKSRRDGDFSHERERSLSRGRDYDRYADYDRVNNSRNYRNYPREDYRYGSGDRNRERSRSNGRSSYLDTDRHHRDSSRSHERSRDDRGRNYEISRSDRPDRFELSTSAGHQRGIFDKLELRSHDREMLYWRRLREWERREVEKERRYIDRKNKEKEDQENLELEIRKLKQFLEDYKDENNDYRFYRGSAMQKRLRERREEIEQDELAKKKEKKELELLKKSCEPTSSPHMINCPDDQPSTPDNDNAARTNDSNANHNKSMNGQNVSNNNGGSIDNSSNEHKSQQQLQEKQSTSREVKRRQCEEIIKKIPQEKDALFAMKIDWSLLDDNLMDKRIRPWISKKIAEYIGEHEVEVIDFVCKLVSDHKDGQYMINEISLFFCDEAEKFVKHMWRLIIFELECKKQGITRNSN